MHHAHTSDILTQLVDNMEFTPSDAMNVLSGMIDEKDTADKDETNVLVEVSKTIRGKRYHIDPSKKV